MWRREPPIEMMRIQKILFLLLLIAEPAFALDMEFYTYGGFMPVSEAFTKIALIFSDASYQGLLFVIAVLGLLAGVMAFLFKAATGARVVPLVWAVPILTGIVFYLAVFVPKGNITVYDAVLNRFQTIGGIPDAIVFTAGFLNKVEKGMVDIIDTAGAPNRQYQRTAGGIGFKGFEAIRGSSPKDTFAKTSMVRYIKDCVTFELSRPGTTLSLDELRNTSTDFLVNLDKAVNPAVFTVSYDATKPEGTTLSCSEAWAKLRPIYANPGNYQEALKKVCAKAFFDPESPTEMTTCRNLLASTVNFATTLTPTPEKIIQQRQIAEILYSFYFQDDQETAVLMESNRRITATGLGIGLTMNEWIPIMRAIMTAIAIGVIPFLVLFLPTPVAGKAASVLFGFFVFLATWGITDAVIHGAAMDYAGYAFEEMRQSSLGVYAMAAFPDIATKLLAMFGVIRSAGIMLASFFAMMLIRFGGHALALLAGNLSRVAQSAGAQAGQLFTPEGTSAAMNQQIRAAGLLAAMPEHRFTNMAATESWSLHRSVGGYSAAMEARNSLQESHHLGSGVSDKEFAKIMAGSKISVGSDRGPAEVSIAPDGHGTRTKLETVNADGSTTVRTTGGDGTGIAVDTMAQGRASYSIGQDGRHVTTHAAVNGLDPVKVGTMAQHQTIVAAANSLGSSRNWQLAMDTAKRASFSDSEARGFTSRLENAERETWRRAVSDQSSFVHSMSEDVRNQFTATVGAGGIPVLRRIGPLAQLLVSGQNSEKVSFNVSEDTARSFENTAARVRSESLQQTLQDSRSLDYTTRLAKQIGATEAYSLLNNARDLNTATESHGADLTTALIRKYTIDHYGSESPENIRQTIADFNRLLTRQGNEGVGKMESLISTFVKEDGHGQGNITKSVDRTIAGIKDRVQDQDLKQNVSTSANDAGAGTFNIRKENFAVPKLGSALNNPNNEAVTSPADDVHRRNLQEESGTGRIHTNALDIAKDIAGLNKDKSLRPTDEYYRNQTFYYGGTLVQPQKHEGIILPSGTVIYGDPEYTPPQKDEDFFKGSVFEKK
jgi:conjugal transfer mating pair stabilization protein TraG